MNCINYAAVECLQVSLKCERIDGIRKSRRRTNVFEGEQHIQNVMLPKNPCRLVCAIANADRYLAPPQPDPQACLTTSSSLAVFNCSPVYSSLLFHKLRAGLIYSTLTICYKQLLNDPP